MGDERRVSGRGWGSSNIVRREQKLIHCCQDAHDGAVIVQNTSGIGRMQKRSCKYDVALTSHPEWRFAFWASCGSDAWEAQDPGNNFC